MRPTFEHTSVLLPETVARMAPADGEVYVDCTVGGGGHTRALLEAADCRVIGLDRDPAALAAATENTADFGDRFVPVRASFSELGDVLDRLGIAHVNGILADLGVSSHQLDTAERGFSFRFSGPLDMRMDPEGPTTAADLCNELDQNELVRILRDYGEERQAVRVARAIVADRPWSDTRALAETVARVVGGKGRIHPATRTFQALRIAVNDELGELERLLPLAVERLLPGGRLCVITFHSLEDRITKRFLDAMSGKGRPRDPYGNPIGPVHLRVFPDVAPSPDEENPRARSARLRSAQRLPWNAP
ncbi:MAG: 16S rRNA (cytosine(1402)-N(4))-methyltransferase RsmH [Alphaproteobacteria bacterium]|nr:16S rRNA (cytosine(1402)-N(4))-methyltransferase RsmH [Alphaproteobacteria bacterium]MCB9696940.1 16S rRNA (cytosine(1402)-N(4))-methyltransferase RsmH [Alphaproteobacteria bacterium]